MESLFFDSRLNSGGNLTLQLIRRKLASRFKQQTETTTKSPCGLKQTFILTQSLTITNIYYIYYFIMMNIHVVVGGV